MSLKAKLRLSWRRWKFKSFLLLTGVLLIFYSGWVPHLKLSLLFIGQNGADSEDGGPNTILREKSEEENRLQKIIHFDFKGAPPRIDYLLNLIPYIKSLGATGILMEYEDMFPYRDELEGISALNAYTVSEVVSLVETARSNNLSVIPLIPTFGHLEFVLKLEKYKQYREIENSTETFCLSQNGIYNILQKMIDQVLEVHRYSTYLHIGCNLAEPLGVCPLCRNQTEQGAWKKTGLYVKHMAKVAGYINSTYPGVRPIVWGNGIRKHMVAPIVYNRIPDLVDIMLLNTKLSVNYFPSALNMKFYAKLFPKVWVAASYKGTEVGSVVTDIIYHMTNLRLWVAFMEEWKSEVEFKGIVLTGWQRCTHFGILGELLPVAVPSIAVVLQSIHDGPDFDYDVIQRALICNEFVPVKVDEFKSEERMDALHCKFPGFELYRVVHYFSITRHLIKESLEKPSLDELTFYNILHNEWRPSYVTALDVGEYEGHLNKLKKVENSLNDVMIKFYDKYAVNEWITTHVIPLRLHLQAVIYTFDSLTATKVWPRRPLTNDIGHFKADFDAICKANDTVKCPFVLIPQLIK